MIIVELPTGSVICLEDTALHSHCVPAMAPLESQTGPFCEPPIYQHGLPVIFDMGPVTLCTERCDYIDVSGRCSRRCAKNIRTGHDICGCAQHHRVHPAVVHMRRFFARHTERRRCISPGCPLTVDDPEHSENYACGCCRAQNDGYAVSAWKSNGLR